MRNPTARAVAATIAFLVAGPGTWYFLVSDWRSAIAPASFYCVLLVNTYFSIRFFSRFSSSSMSQAVTDGVLFLVYIALALSITNTVRFMCFAVCIFVGANVKYILLLPTVNETPILKKKIIIDSLGAALCVAGLAGALANYEDESAIAVAITFAIANVYLLMVRPMYSI